MVREANRWQNYHSPFVRVENGGQRQEGSLTWFVCLLLAFEEQVSPKADAIRTTGIAAP